MKKCTKCNQEKSFDHFGKCGISGYQSYCKDCHKQYYKTNVDKIKEQLKKYYKANSDKLKEQSKQYRKANIDKAKERDKEYRKLNSDKIKQYKKRYSQENPEKIKEWKQKNSERLRKCKYLYHTNRLKNDPLYKFSHNVRTLIRGVFKRGELFKKQTKTEQLLGCTIPELRDHLQKQFKEGMTFENHGEWHIDHIIPLSFATTQTEIERLCHYTNLQPLWAKENLSKGNRV